ncbi:hypothetical protein [uncultured Lutibacter sp.]|uniref:DUF6712 family protein n=1 Tax=uncultured Lutibacter sp. TaxID=437739 RepID=UPI00260C078B|nr:hypothetical protein [uncultured Lutibacter sp.]
MAELLFITPEEMTYSTILSGNIDVDKYRYVVLNTQVTTIEPLLGSELYDKIIADLEGDTLTGLYLTLYNDYIKPITKFESVAQFIEVASYLVDNGGIFKQTPEGKEVVTKDEVQYLSQKYKSLSQMYVTRFNKWICNNTLTEYKTYQDEVNAIKDISLLTGWKL